MKIKYLFASLLLSFMYQIVVAQDISGSKDHQLISRFPGSEIVSYYASDYNELKFAIKPAKEEQAPKDFIEANGKHTAIMYKVPEGKSTVEVMKNYRDAITAKGGEILFTCSGGECDGTQSWYAAKFFLTIFSENFKAGNIPTGHYFPLDAYDVAQKYLVAKVTTADMTYYIEIGMSPKYDKPVHISVEIVEVKNMQSGQIQLNADLIKEKMDKEGKVALYGIYFDTGKSTLKPESYKELDLVVSYLNKNAAVKIYVVGHTDDQGGLEANLQLSKDRAAAVKKYLLSKSISDVRIIADGVASLAPVASNESDTGRQKNRRVEIVKRLK